MKPSATVTDWMLVPLSDVSIEDDWFVSGLSGADTVSRLMGWMGSVFAENPDQRRRLLEYGLDRRDVSALGPQALEHPLRESLGERGIAFAQRKEGAARAQRVHSPSRRVARK